MRIHESIVITAVAGLWGSAFADPPVVEPQVTLVADDSDDFDALGVASAIGDSDVLLGAPGLDGVNGATGGVVVFRRTGDTWSDSQVLVPSSAASGDEFGAAVALDGVRSAVGGRMAAVDGLPAAGQVGVFTFNGSAWGEAAVLTAPVPQESAGFGTAVAISGDVLVVGAPMHDTAIRNEGLVHIFRFVSPVWTLETTLAAPDAGENDRFGTSVAIDGDRLVVGAPRDDDQGIDGGAVWVFEFDQTWTAMDKIVRTTNDWQADFGGTVAISGDWIAVGASRDDVLGVDDGAVRLYHRGSKGGWIEEAVLVAPGSPGAREFGWSVALDGDRMVAGMPVADDFGVDSGGAVLFRFADGVWSSEAVIDGKGSGSLLGTTVSIAGSRLCLGAPLDSTAVAYGGAGEVLDLTEDCDGDGVPDIIAIADGRSNDDDGDGIPDECVCPADLFVDGVVNGGDLGVFLTYYGYCGAETGNPSCIGDLNGDGDVRGADLGLLLAQWGTCGG